VNGVMNIATDRVDSWYDRGIAETPVRTYNHTRANEADQDVAARNGAVVVKRVLVTGASGFVAGHLVPYLAGAGFDVIAASRDPNLRVQPSEVPVVRLPASKDEWLSLLPGIDAVVHLAGLAHRAANAEEHDRVNRVLAAEAAEAAQASGVKHFIFVSSIAAQSGPGAPHVLTEADQPHPDGAYGIAKLAAEKAVGQSGVPFTILRPVVIDGPGAKGNVAILNLLVRIPVPLPFGALDNKRSTLSISNFNSAVGTVLFNPKAVGETFVVADPDALTVAEIITRVRQRQGQSQGLFNVSPKLLQLGLQAVGKGVLWDRLGRPLVVDPAKLLSLGWTPQNE
jgi:UDP-glucose 4-epimerase